LWGGEAQQFVVVGYYPMPNLIAIRDGIELLFHLTGEI
jgi:hypothetical protein